MKVTRKRLRALSTVTALAIAVGVSLGAAAWDGGDTERSDTARIAPSRPVPASPPQPGREPSVGPWSSTETAPDLTPIELGDGRTGYLRTHDLASSGADSRFDRPTGKGSGKFVLPVYDRDGQTVISEFVAGTYRTE